MATTKRKKSRFWKGLLIYVLLFAMFGAGVLIWLHRFLRNYEAGQPDAVLHSYLDAEASGRLSYPWGVALGRLDAAAMDESARIAWAQEKLQGASVRELLGAGESGEKVYGLYDESGRCFETVTLRQVPSEDRDAERWEVAGETVDLEPYTVTVSVTAPEDYTVQFAGETLGGASVVETGVRYRLLEPFRDSLSSEPTMVRYQYGPILGEGELTVLDAGGNPVPEELQTEEHYLDNCSDSDRARLQDFAERWLAVYLPYADDLNRAGMGYFMSVYAMIVTGGELEARLRQAMENFGFGNVQSIEVLSVDMKCCTDLGGGRYLAAFDYHLRTTGLHGPTEEDYSMSLLLVDRNGQLLAEQMVLE